MTRRASPTAATEEVLDAMVRAAAHDVPDGSSDDDVHRWLHDLDPGVVDWVSADRVSVLLESLDWLRVTETTAFWESDRPRLGEATGALVGGLWHLGLPCGLEAMGGPSGITLRLGTSPGAAASLARLVAAFLPGTETVRDAPGGLGGAWDTGSAPLGVALWGPPPTTTDTESVIGRLGRLGPSRWLLRAVLAPVPVGDLDERSWELSALAARVAATAHQQVTVSDLVTASFDDPESERLSAGIARKRDAVAAALRAGAWAAVSWIESPTESELAAAVGAAVAPAGLRVGEGDRSGSRVPITGWRPMIASQLSPSLLTSAEAGELLRPPSDDRLGLPSRRWVHLHRHPEPLQAPGAHIVLGTTEDDAGLGLPTGALTAHMLVTGSPGSGKTTAIASILDQLAGLGVPFLVVEPVKREYRGLMIDDVITWSPASSDPGPDWVLNPLEVPHGVSVQSHVERLVTLFRATFGLITPLPFLVELGLQRVYEARGWDLADDRRPASGDMGWPTPSELISVCAGLPAELGYAPEIRANLHAAIHARLGTLTRGPKGRVLDRDRLFPISEIMASRVVMNLDDLGDDETRAFMMGLVLLRLREERRVGSGGVLEHVTVFEEAHRLLASNATGGEHSTEGTGDASGHLAGEIASLLAEIRSTGEGVIVVDQSPSMLVPSVLANTATKLALRADLRRDQHALAAAIGLPEQDAHILGSSRRHEALTTWEGMDMPIRARLHYKFLDNAGDGGVPPRPRSNRVPLPDRRLRGAVRTLVRTVGAGGAAQRAAVDALTADQLGVVHPAAVAEAVAELIRREVEAIGRARRWGETVRAAAAAAVLSGIDTASHPARVLQDGRLPLPSCRSACPGGGCLLGEPAREEAERILAEGPSTLIRLIADPEERRRRLARRALDVVGDHAPESLSDLAAACVTVQVFDDWADPSTVAGLVTSARRDAGGEPTHSLDHGDA